ncbi:MAG: L,D-transpeptidase [Methylorubrum populi]
MSPARNGAGEDDAPRRPNPHSAAAGTAQAWPNRVPPRWFPSLDRIHGTNEPETIGQAVSAGCLRKLDEDVMDLYERVPVGTRVLVR